MTRTKILFAVGTLLWIAAAAAEPPAVATIDAQELVAREAARDPALVVVDVRSSEEFAAGHVPGAINVPQDQLAGRLAELAPLRDRDVVVYCKSGRRSALALEVLSKNGYTRLSHLEGDMQGWEAAGRPVEKASGAATPAPKP